MHLSQFLLDLSGLYICAACVCVRGHALGPLGAHICVRMQVCECVYIQCKRGDSLGYATSVPAKYLTWADFRTNPQWDKTLVPNLLFFCRSEVVEFAFFLDESISNRLLFAQNPVDELYYEINSRSDQM